MRRARSLACLALLVLCLGAWPVAAAPERADGRVALVIGNSDYAMAPLKNPVNDARAMARVLREVGFEVAQFENVSQPQFIAALREFSTRLRATGGVGLFYFAGHGMAIKGVNYLLPVDADIRTEDEVRFRSVDANEVVAKMEAAGNRLNIVILDACRDNPFARSSRSKTSGLAQMDASTGMLVAFATAPGSVAYDGDGSNGVYTSNLLKNMLLPGLPIEMALKRVREGVVQQTEHKQTPWESSSLIGDFCFVSCPGQEPVTRGEARPEDPAIEVAYWNSIKDGSSIADLYLYLSRYPNGHFRDLADQRIARQLKGEGDATRVAQGRSEPTQVALAAQAAARPPVAVVPPVVQAHKGDRWTYVVSAGAGAQPFYVTARVSAVDGDQIREDVLLRGKAVPLATRTFRAGFDAAAPFQEAELPGQVFLPEFSPYVATGILPVAGQAWKDLQAQLTAVVSRAYPRATFPVEIVVQEQERIKVPAGEFDTVRVLVRTREVDLAQGGDQVKFSDSASLLLTYWYSKDVHRAVKMRRRQSGSYSKHNSEVTFELTGYQQSAN